MKTLILSTRNPKAISTALKILENNGTVAFPTDTVYGLATSAFNPQAIEKLFQIKGRDQNQAIAVLIGQAIDLNFVADNPSAGAMRLATIFWPGALTLVVPRHPNLSKLLSPQPTIGVRIPDHPVAIDLLKKAGPLAVTSANLSGGENTKNTLEVLAQLEGKIDLILDGGDTPGGLPSTVVDVLGINLKILRTGPISEKELLKVWKENS